MHMKFTYSKKH